MAAQQYEHVTALVALQDLPDEDVQRVEGVAQLMRESTGLKIDLENFKFPKPGDYRGALLNRALTIVKTRYVAFLDYDDVIYPHHAKTLIEDLQSDQNNEISASFGGCILAHYDDLPDGGIFVTSKREYSDAPSIIRCVDANCFPIHSYVLDLTRIKKFPKFGEDSPLLEDYVFLLDLFEENMVSTNFSRTALCEYRMNSDNSNTVSVDVEGAPVDHEKKKQWVEMLQGVEKEKSGRSFRIPYSELELIGDLRPLSNQPFLRGLFVCLAAKKIRKRYGVDEAIRFLGNPKKYARALPQEKRFLLLRCFF